MLASRKEVTERMRRTMKGSIGKNDSNREMNLRAKPNVMNQAINRRACDKMKGQIMS